MGFLFSGDGRIRRTHYGLGGLLVWILMTAILIIGLGIAAGAGVGAAGAEDAAVAAVLTPVALAGFGIGLAAVILMLWAFVALTSKRLHDIGQSGWWTLIVLLPGVGAFALFLILCLLPGNSGPNRYGPDPRGDLVALAG